MVEELCSVYAINVDYTKIFSNKKIDFVEAAIETPLPVVRIYGSTEYGQKICVNIHGAFPYFYFRPQDMSDPKFNTFELVERFEFFCSYLYNFLNANIKYVLLICKYIVT
jgi:hypothetical protein